MCYDDVTQANEAKKLFLTVVAPQWQKEKKEDRKSQLFSFGNSD